MRLVGQASYLEHIGPRGEQTEDGQGRPGVVTPADATVVSELGESLSRNHFRDNDRCPCLSLGFDDIDRPAMVPVTVVEGRNQKPGVGERAQPPYTVSSMVSERLGGPWSTPTKLRMRSIWPASAAKPVSTSWTMSPLCVVPRLRAALRRRSSSERGRVMFFLTCVAI
jgi:hypothetical protein